MWSSCDKADPAPRGRVKPTVRCWKAPRSFTSSDRLVSREPAHLRRPAARRPHDTRATLVLDPPVTAAPRGPSLRPVEEPSVPPGGDPWEDERWRGVKWTVYRGVAYDLTAFIDAHPAGNWLIQLGLGRDCTALFESYHLRPEVAVARLRRLPVLRDFPIDAVPRAPYPNDSELYCAVRRRVRAEVFRGQDATGAHRSGSEGAAAAILGYAAAAYAAYAAAPSVVTGFALGLGGAWIGLTVQHCGNHGAMSTRAWVNKALGLCDDLIGGSSLMWRYHHQVSHHVQCNDDALDEDVFSAFPALRFDARLPRRPWHQWQHIYMWATFPLLLLAFQAGDLQGLVDNRTVGATLHGADRFEKASVLAGKVAHYSLLAALPIALHGVGAVLPAMATYIATQGVVLAATFAVSHNVEEAKPLAAGNPATASLAQDHTARDWGVQQVLTSANWGGVVGNFFTGGLNLQVEHHLFPAISFMHYPAIARIVEDECKRRRVPYAHYDTLPQIIARFTAYMKAVGSAPQLTRASGGVSDAEVAAHKAGLLAKL